MESSSFRPSFEIDLQDPGSHARLGRLNLKRGTLNTPAFMPVGTHGALRGVSATDLKDTGAEIMLCNTYHMYVRPGVELIDAAGGLHSFISWERPILTDSGGFQVFSLAKQRKITEEGCTFKNPWNGDAIKLTPEIVLDAQERFGSDVMMILDECPPATGTPYEIAQAVGRTTRWASRALDARKRRDLALFAIVQGGSHHELREQSLRELLELENPELDRRWDGIAVGGMSVGETKDNFVATLHSLRGMLPADRAHYLMGVGTPRDLVFAVACGMDMFDCVLPSRNGRHGIVMTREGRMNLFNAKHTRDFNPISASCRCTTCSNYSRAFLRHLFIIEDSLAGRLTTIHNVQYLLDLMTEVRGHIKAGTFVEFAQDFLQDPKHIFLGVEKTVTAYPQEFKTAASF